MSNDKDFSAEDDKEAVVLFEAAASSEFTRLVERLKAEEQATKALAAKLLVEEILSASFDLDEPHGHN